MGNVAAHSAAQEPERAREQTRRNLRSVATFPAASGEIPVTNVEIAISDTARCNELIEGDDVSSDGAFVYSHRLVLCVMPSDLNCPAFSRAFTFITVRSAGAGLLIVLDCYFAISSSVPVSGKMHHPLNVAIMALGITCRGN